ncbi:hypothetical protein [Petrotoga sp. 8T1HF07.NaAc.6.1]|uniref:hypothetical protein n=1 Tax=Petrotoga sp. 8T1HF07.NaAc.6.1 TaxID=1351838 RepID=UPI003080B840
MFEISGITNAKKTGIKGKTHGLKNDNNPPENAVKKLTEFVMAREFIVLAPLLKLLKVSHTLLRYFNYITLDGILATKMRIRIS